jgi:hypothetical protein
MTGVKPTALVKHEAKPVDVPVLERIASTRSRRQCLVPGGFVITVRKARNADDADAEIRLIEAQGNSGRVGQ